MGIAGNYSSAVCFGGYASSYSAVTEKFNGSTWSTSANLNTARDVEGDGGSVSNAVAAGGYTGSYSNKTELFTDSVVSYAIRKIRFRSTIKINTRRVKMEYLQTFVEEGLRNLSSTDCLPAEDIQYLREKLPELQDNYEKKQVFRTYTEMVASVLNDASFPDNNAKYWQCVRELDVMFTNLAHDNF